MQFLKNKKNILIITFILIIIGFITFYHSKKEVKEYKVLYIASYHSTFSWVKEIERGVKKSFFDKKIKMEYDSFYMNTKIDSKPEQIKSKANEAKEIITKFNPDIIIVSDENALNSVALPLRNSKYNFIFCGINGEPEQYNLPASNITGVLERHHFIDAIKILKLIKPKVKNIAVLSENSESSQLIISQLKKDTKNMHVNFVGIHQTNSYEKWKELVLNYQKKADALMIILYFTLKDKYGEPVDGREVIEWTTENSDLPEVSTFTFLPEDGGLLSVSVNGFSQGYMAADMAIKVLKGEKLSNLNIKSTKDGIIYINAQRAQSLKLKIPVQLIESSKIIW